MRNPPDKETIQLELIKSATIKSLLPFLDKGNLEPAKKKEIKEQISSCSNLKDLEIKTSEIQTFFENLEKEKNQRAKTGNDPRVAQFSQKESKQSKSSDGASGQSNWIEDKQIILNKLNLSKTHINQSIMLKQKKISLENSIKMFPGKVEEIEGAQITARFREAVIKDKQSIEIERLIKLCETDDQRFFKKNFPNVIQHINFLDNLIEEKTEEIKRNTFEFDQLKASMRSKLIAKLEDEAKAEAEAKREAKREAEAKALQETKNKAKKEAEEKTKREAEEKTKREAEEKAKKEVEEKTKREAEEKAKKEVEEKAKKEVEEKARTEAKKLQKEKRTNEFNRQQALNSAQREAVTEILTEITSEFLIQAIKNALDEFKAEEEAKRKLEEKAKIEAEAQAKQQIEEIKDRILAKTSANFEKFQSFFDHLRDIKWLEIGEIGLFGSRVYREVISETCPALEIPKNPQADFDFFCIPRGVDSSGIFKLCHQESASRDNFREVIEDFNKKNPNLQIYFKDEEIPYALDEIVKKDGEKSVNFLANQSINFKLVAVILEDKKTSKDETGEEKTEKIVKEKVEFDLNFYTQRSMLENLQWQFNLERVLLAQNPDQTFTLKINHCNCDPSQEKMTIEDFFAKALGEEMREFLFESNPQARGFLNRMINKKGIYKYLGEDTLNALKSGLLEDEYIKENLKKELLLYKKIVDDIASKSPESEMVDEKFKQAKFILDTIEKDEIFKENKDFQEILRTIPRVTPAGANVGQSSSMHR